MVLFADAVYKYEGPGSESAYIGDHMVIKWEDPRRSNCCKAAHNTYRVKQPHLFCTCQFITSS